MSESTESRFSVTARTGAGYDASLVTVRGETAEELAEGLSAVTNGELAELVVEMQSMLQAVGAINAPVPAAAPAAQAAPATPVPASAGVAELRVCPHGKRQMKTGHSAKGPWTGWFCPLPKGNPSQCKPDWE